MAQTAQIILDVQNQQAVQSLQILAGNVQGLAGQFQNLKAQIAINFQTANQLLQATTGQAQQLEKQILGLTGTFASLSSVFVSGVSLNDPLDKINALQPAIEQSIAKVREISLTISGVTSADLVNVFQTIATNSSQANLSLDQSVQLVKSFSAGLVSANIPLFQQRQEISSILTGQITQDSTLAKQLGITNEIVAREKARGNLVAFLNDRLKTSVVIQEKFSQTIEGASSNILEIGELTQSAFGQQLLKPITDTLNSFYSFLDENKDKIFGFARFLGDQFVVIGEVIKNVFDAIAPLLVSVGNLLGNLGTDSIKIFTGTLSNLGNVLAGVATILSTVLTPVFSVLNSDLGKAAIAATLLAVAFNAGAVGAAIRLGEALISIIASTGAFVASSAVRIAGIIAETTASQLLSVTLGQLVVAQTAVATSGSAAASGAVLLAGGLVTVAVAVAGAAVALSYLNRQNELFIEQSEALNKLNNPAIDNSNKLVASLKKLEEQRLKNGALTKEEEETQRIRTKQAALQIEDNNARIANLKVQISENNSLRESQEPIIKQLERQNEQLSKIQTAGLKVSAIGTAYNFLGQQAKTALAVIKAGVNQEDFDKRSKEITDITKQQVELGLITRQQGIEQLEVIAKNENATVELRASANKQILALIKDTNKEELELNKQKQAEQEQLAANGFISEGESLKKISELKKQSLEIDAENARAANKKIAEDSARERFSTLSKAQQELDELKNTKPTGDEAQDAVTLRAVEEKRKEIAKINENFDNQERNNQRKFAADEAKIRADKLKAEQDDINKQVKFLRGVLDRELEENGNLRKKAEFATQADIQALKLGGFKNELVLEEQTLRIKKQTIEAEIFDKRRSLEFDKTLLANFRGSQSEKEALILKISKQEIDIAKLNLDATDNLISRTKILYDAKIKGIEQEKESLDKTSKLLQSQNDLQSARIGLTKAVQDAELKAGESRLSNLKEVGALLKQNNDSNRDRVKREANEELKASRELILAKLSDEEKAAKQKEFQAEDQAKAESEAKEKQAKEDAINAQKSILTRQRLAELGFGAGTSELDIARRTFEQEQKNLELKARQFEATQANEQRSLLISQQQAEIKDRQLAAEAKIALFRAQESGRTDLIASALELVNLTDAQIKNNKELAKVQTDTLNVKQASDREAFNQEQSSASFKNRLAGVEAGLTAGQVTTAVSENIKAQAVTAAPIASEKEATKTIKANQKENIQKVLDERSQTLASVADGAVAFEDTSEQVAKNFDKLPKSLKSTADGLKEVIGFAKELSENPLFASREEAAKKEAANKVTLQKQEKEDREKPQSTTQVNNLLAKETDIRAKNQAISANNERITDRNNLGRVGNEIVSVDTSILGIGNQAELEATREANRENDRRLRAKKRTRERGLFTGGMVVANEPVTVNEQGQEAVTNLRTGETSLLPFGERQVIFSDTSYIHNAPDTRAMLNPPTQSINGIESRAETQNNYPVLEALGKIHDLLASREPKIDNTNNFYNEPKPDQMIYETLRGIRRAVAS